MTEAAAATQTADKAETEAKPLTGKEQIYVKIAQLVHDKTGKKIGKTGGHELFDVVVQEIFALACREKTMRFNLGFGSLHVRTYGAGSRRLPSGETTTFGERVKLRYEEGVVTTALLANGGDLTEAMKARGSRARKEGSTEEVETEASEAPAATNGAPADAGDDIDLD